MALGVVDKSFSSFWLVSFLYFFIIPLVLLKFIINYKHLLVRLLCLEFISLRFFLGIRSRLDFFVCERVFLLYFLVIVVCEGVLGLCLLILLRFFYGDDYLFRYNKLTC